MENIIIISIKIENYSTKIISVIFERIISIHGSFVIF